jgi:hypothetical protein
MHPETSLSDDRGMSDRRTFLGHLALVAPIGGGWLARKPEHRRRLGGDERPTGADEAARAPVILADGTAHVFRYDLDTGAVADWEAADRDGEPVWQDDRAVHWIDTTVVDPDADRPGLAITIYQEVVFAEDCDGSGIAHPALSPAEWARTPSVSNMDLDGWLVLLAADEIAAAFDAVVRQLYGAAVEEPPEQYGVAADERDAFEDGTYPGACRIRLVGINPDQVVRAGHGPVPAARNGSVAVRIPAIPVGDWAQLSLDADTESTGRPHWLVPDWRRVLVERVEVDLAPLRHVEKLLGREPCARS